MPNYWLLEWLDSEGLESVDAATTAIKNQRVLERLLDTADKARALKLEALPRGKNLVAGTSNDLSGVLGCGAAACLIATVDNLIDRSWAYFDHVIVSGADPNEIIEDAGTASHSELCSQLVDHIKTALYIREVGASDFFVFRRKEGLCLEHLDQHAREAGLLPVSQFVIPLAEELASGYTLQQHETRAGLQYFYQHPSLSTGITGYNRSRLKRNELGRRLARVQANKLAAGLTRSVWLARTTHSTLGQSALTSGHLVNLPPEPDFPITPSQVALELRLPKLIGAEPAELLAIRRDEANEFEVFRSALTRTMDEKISTLPDAKSDRIAEAVVGDVLQPAVAAIDRSMQRSAALLGRRSVATIAVGGVLTTVGLLALAPLVVPGIVLTAGALATSYNDYLKDRRELELSDLHFLWHADKRLHE